MIILIKYGGEYGHFIRLLLISRVCEPMGRRHGAEDQVSYFLHRVVMVNKKHKHHGSKLTLATDNVLLGRPFLPTK